ncbi:MAG: DUF3108 domain-containing protein [Kiritimatiellales bacterium]|nr:DUF3108 domain-containing protein [Kiritimatiellales bacterium]
MVRFLSVIAMCLFLSSAAAAATLPFPLNERLEYRISWNGIPVAWSVATTGLVETNGMRYVALRIETQTYSVFDVFYKVKDMHECLLDQETLLPARFSKTMREGRSHYQEVTIFDYALGTARFENLETGISTNVPIDANTRDYLSFMYFMRGKKLEPETTTIWPVLADDRVYKVTVHAEKIEKIGLSNYPDVPSLRIVPEAEFNGLFVRNGTATLWVSQDVRRILTCMKARVPFGRVTVKLQDVSGGTDDFWITEKKD